MRHRATIEAILVALAMSARAWVPGVQLEALVEALRKDRARDSRSAAEDAGRAVQR